MATKWQGPLGCYVAGGGRSADIRAPDMLERKLENYWNGLRRMRGNLAGPLYAPPAHKLRQLPSPRPQGE